MFIEKKTKVNIKCQNCEDILTLKESSTCSCGRITVEEQQNQSRVTGDPKDITVLHNK